jgi:hypothetical protein
VSFQSAISSEFTLCVAAQIQLPALWGLGSSPCGACEVAVLTLPSSVLQCAALGAVAALPRVDEPRDRQRHLPEGTEWLQAKERDLSLIEFSSISKRRKWPSTGIG